MRHSRIRQPRRTVSVRRVRRAAIARGFLRFVRGGAMTEFKPYTDPTTGEWVGEHETRLSDGGVSRQTEWFATEQEARDFARAGKRQDTPPDEIAAGTVPCRAYAMCDRMAVMLYDFGPVGLIPTCKRCADKTDRLRRRP